MQWDCLTFATEIVSSNSHQPAHVHNNNFLHLGGDGLGDMRQLQLAPGRGGTIHRCIDISRYFSLDTYRDIIFYNRNFFISFLFPQ